LDEIKKIYVYKISAQLEGKKKKIKKNNTGVITYQVERNRAK